MTTETKPATAGSVYDDLPLSTQKKVDAISENLNVGIIEMTGAAATVMIAKLKVPVAFALATVNSVALVSATRGMVALAAMGKSGYSREDFLADCGKAYDDAEVFVASKRVEKLMADAGVSAAELSDG